METIRTDYLLSALQKARQEFKPLERNGLNKFFKTQDGGFHTFSTLDDIFKSCKEALNKNELSLYYTVTYEDGLNFLTTILTHLPSGQSIQSRSAIGTASSNPQQIGSGITYMRRYHIQAMLNLEADFEDDGNVAAKQPTNVVHQTKKPAPTNDNKPKGGL